MSSRLYCHTRDELKIINPDFDWENHVDVFLDETGPEWAYRDLIYNHPPPYRIIVRTEEELNHWKWLLKFYPEPEISFDILEVKPYGI